VLPEYPRPQLVRDRWSNLNGRWEYAITDSGSGAPNKYDGTILVPFPVESQLSGVQRRVSDAQNLWYRRTFQAPKLAAGERLLLHFGAVDWEAKVLINGREVGSHQGGFDPFSFDITDALRASGDQELVVRAWDPTDRGPQPRGKQIQQPRGIFYTPVTGIWQTVWIEPVPAARINDLVVTPDIDAGTLTVRVNTAGATGEKVRVSAVAAGKTIVNGQGDLTQPIVLRIPHAHLWSPTDPFLYDLNVRLSSGDEVKGYFGMRKISVAKDSAGVLRLALNNKPLFEFGPLDQGWWPDGLYTAPTDEALRYDIEATKQLGFNMIRKHVKVEPARWYYHADKLGMLVWQDMPSANNDTPEGRAQFERELRALIGEHRNFPSIVMWVPFNEGWGQFDTQRITGLVKQLDPTRLVNNASGWTDMGVGDVVDAHVYPGPGLPIRDSSRAMVLGEFGGLGLPLAGHTWVSANNWGYQSFTGVTALDSAYRALARELGFMVSEGLSAAVYTQTTDVETEVNGLMTYDREVAKISPQTVAVNSSLWSGTRGAMRRAVVATSLGTPQTWRYTTTQPDSSWMQPGFNDSAWQIGAGGFGQGSTAGAAMMPVKPGTAWSTPNIWLRRNFTIRDTSFGAPQWRIYFSGNVDLYLNGTHVGSFSRGTNTYVPVPLSATARAALRPGTNTLAVRVQVPQRFQYVDVGIEDAPTLAAEGGKKEIRNGATSRTTAGGQGISPGGSDLVLDFSAHGAPGSIKDAGGAATGFTARLPGTGVNAPDNDPNLLIETFSGLLNVTTTTADYNGQRNIPDAEAVGVNLKSLGFTGSDDFSVSARFVKIPGNEVLDIPDQLGLFIGTSTTSMMRAGLLNLDRYATAGTTRSNLAFSTVTQGEQDSNSHWVGTPNDDKVGETMTVEISRKAGKWSAVVNGQDVLPNAKQNGSGAAMPPTFLDGQTDLVVGVFALDVGGKHKKFQVDKFEAHVYKK